ncbi:TPA: hypothetical protein MH406_05545 [Klebsiella pneumoniae]|nr:hypothetical protein DMQ18_25295 [Klebsiella pneumoniae]HBX5306498.1 hypothetical protein [Klebsiella pneumoniae]HBY8125037.1 hypothetical protein [Klebsiella pneumoniae]
MQSQRRRTRTAASLLCRAAATPCPAYDPCCLSLIFLPLLLKLAVVGLNTTDTLPPGRGY